MTNRSSGSCGGREFLRGRATPVIEGICCEKIRGCSYREGDASFPPTPDADRVPQGNEMRKNTSLGVVKPLRSFRSSCCDEGGSYDV